jgi:hypothetical protein
MIAHKSRCDILVYAMSVVRTIALGTLTALVANAAHLPSKYVVRPDAQIHQVDCASVSRAAQPPKEVRDPFASMLRDAKRVNLAAHNMLDICEASGFTRSVVISHPDETGWRVSSITN